MGILSLTPTIRIRQEVMNKKYTKTTFQKYERTKNRKRLQGKISYVSFNTNNKNAKKQTPTLETTSKDTQAKARLKIGKIFKVIIYRIREGPKYLNARRPKPKNSGTNGRKMRERSSSGWKRQEMNGLQMNFEDDD